MCDTILFDCYDDDGDRVYSHEVANLQCAICLEYVNETECLLTETDKIVCRHCGK